jgi:hypothetical protein
MTTDDFAASVQDPIWWTIVPLILAWTLLWKGLALYRAGANRSPGWFVVLLVLNTLGILEILYFFIFSRGRKRDMDAQLGQARS